MEKGKYFNTLAQPEDAHQIGQLIEQDRSKGPFQIISARRPDAYQSYKSESSEVLINMTKKQDNTLISQNVCILRDLQIQAASQRVGYLCGQRLQKNAYYPLRFILKSFDTIRSHYPRVEIFFTSFLTHNTRAHRFFLKQSPHKPDFHFLDEYCVYFVKTGLKTKKTSLYFRQAREGDYPAVMAFLTEHGKKVNFFPDVSKTGLSEFNGLNISDFYILEKEGEILACGALWDQVHYKQYIICRYSPLFRFLKHFNFALKFLGFFPLPREKQVVNFRTLTLFAAKNNCPRCFTAFFRNISCAVPKTDSFFAVGLTSTSPYTETLKRIPHIPFRSRIYLVDYFKDGRFDALLKSANFYFECGHL